MDDRGRIYTPEEVAAFNEMERRAKKLLPIPDDQLGAVRGMNRKQRRAWHAQQRQMARREARAEARQAFSDARALEKLGD